jgi:hypothetical protein
MVWVRSPTIRDHEKDVGVVGRIILRWKLGRSLSIGRTALGWLRICFDKLSDTELFN